MMSQMAERPWSRWRGALHQIIFEADTPAGRAFDVGLLWSIILSVATVMLESVSSIRAAYGDVLHVLEWLFTILFTIEYILRLLSVQRPLAYASSFFGVVDLLAVIPTYLSVLVPGSQYLLSIRILRLLRIFRIFKLTEYLSEASVIRQALLASRRKISVFLFAVMTVVVIIGSVMYVVEGEERGFSDIPTSIYWGHSDDDHGGLWRLVAANRSRQSVRFDCDDYGVRHTRGSDRHSDCGNDPGFQARRKSAGMSGVRRGRA
jgi:voltage-gated potassium channel